MPVINVENACATGSTALHQAIHYILAGGADLAQTYELVTQLRGRAGIRQVKRAKTGMQINGGGVIGVEEAALGANIFRKTE